MRQVRNWYQLLEQSGLVANDSGPGAAQGTLAANVARCPYYYPPGTLYCYKGVIIAASESRIVSTAAAGFPAAAGSIEMLVKPSWNNADGINHDLFCTYGGSNRVFELRKTTGNLTQLFTDNTDRGTFAFDWVANTLYHIVLNWGVNQLYINKVLVKTFAAGGLGNGASTLYIGDHSSIVSRSFSGNIYYFIVRDVALTLAEITTFYNFFVNQYT